MASHLNLEFGHQRAKFISAIMESEKQESHLSSLASRFLKLGWIPNIKWLRRGIVAVIGFTVLLVGVAMIVLPGPAFLVIPLGLAILATEFVWAATLLNKAKSYFQKGKDRVMGKKAE
jgi:tellurite resistance protein TerC